VSNDKREVYNIKLNWKIYEISIKRLVAVRSSLCPRVLVDDGSACRLLNKLCTEQPSILSSSPHFKEINMNPVFWDDRYVFSIFIIYE